MTIEQKYKEWSQTADVVRTEWVGAFHSGHTQTVYNWPDGTEIYDHYVMPPNPFKQPYGWVIVYFPVLNNDFNLNLIKRFNGELDDQHYLDESLALLRFDNMDNAWYGFYVNKDQFQTDGSLNADSY